MKYIFIILTCALLANANPFFKNQWGLVNSSQKYIKIIGELEKTEVKGIKGIDINWKKPNLKKKPIIAIIDTGLDIYHPEFKDKIWKNPEFSKEFDYAPELSLGKNFLVGDYKKKIQFRLDKDDQCKKDKIACVKQLAKSTFNVMDDKGHGTHVSGIAAARDDDQGIVGVSPDALIMPLKVIDNDVSGYFHNGQSMVDIFAKAIEFAVKNKADVINMSVGFPSIVLTERFKKAIKLASDKNIPIVVAAGNNNKEIAVYPCSFESVICVGAIDHEGKIPNFSNFGHKVDILAPGENILSTYPLEIESELLRIQGYEYIKGSSQAAPFVTGVVANIKGTYPDISLKDLKNRLFSNTKDIFEKQKHSMFGLIDQEKSLTKIQKSIVVPEFKGRDKIEIDSNREFTYDLKLKNLGLPGEVKLKLRSELIKFNKSQFVKFINDELVISINGKVEDLEIDFNIPVIIELSMGEFIKKFQINLNATKKISLETLDRIEIPEQNLSNVLLFRRGKKTSLLRYIQPFEGSMDNIEYYYLDRSKKEKIHLNVLIHSQGELKKFELIYPREEKINHIVKGDYNLDGKSDYLVITRKVKNPDRSNKQRALYTYNLYFYQSDFTKLYPENLYHWTYTDNFAVLDSSQGLLPFKNRQSKVNWIKHSHPLLGNIMLPIIKRVGVRLNIDNGDDLFDFDLFQKANRYYVLIPNELRVLEPRVFKSFEFEQTLQKSLGVSDSTRIRFLSIISSTQGAISFIAQVEVGRESKYYLVNFNEFGKYTISSEILTGVSFLEKSVTLNLQKHQNESLLFRLVDQSLGSINIVSDTGELIESKDLPSKGWDDPIISHLGSYKFNEQSSVFLESRYWMHLFSGDQHFTLPINRESSFPGVFFKETMEVIETSIKGVLTPSLFVNSTLLYGDQLYSSVKIGDEFIRPINFSVSVPENCTYVAPGKTNFLGAHHYLLNCKLDNKAYLYKVPLEI